MAVVVITSKEYRKGRAVFESQEGYRFVVSEGDEASVAEAVRGHGAGHVIVGVERYTDALYRALGRGGVIARFGVGHDGIDKGKATEAGLFCTNTPGVLADSVAELTMGLILSAARRIPAMHESVRAGRWEMNLGESLSGKKLAVIGCGAIGRRTAQIAHFGFHMKVTGYVRQTAEAGWKQEFGFDELTGDFGGAVRDADFVSLHISASPENCHFINEERLSLFPKKARLINTARGSVVDEVALHRALAERAIAGAALDVFENEPYRPVRGECDLRTLDNVILLPHLGSSTRDAAEGMARRCMRNIGYAEAGRYSEMDLLNPEALDTFGGGGFMADS